MSVELIIELIGLTVKLEPEAVTLVNNLIALFEGKTTAEQQTLLDQLKAAMQPMVLKS